VCGKVTLSDEEQNTSEGPQQQLPSLAEQLLLTQGNNSKVVKLINNPSRK